MNNKKLFPVWVTFSLLTISLLNTSRLNAQGSLQVNYGANGVQSLSYNGAVLEDLNACPSDVFHIWHMKATDLSGNELSAGDYGWGENANSKSWNSVIHAWIYKFSWGIIQVQYAQAGADLNITVTTTNDSGSGIIFDGASIYPLALHLPRLPAGFVDPSYAQIAFNNQAPGVTLADFGSGEVVAVATDASKPLYSGFQPTGTGIAYTPIMSGTSLDSLASFQPHFDRPVQPGQTDTYTVSLRFAPSGTSTATLAADAYSNFAAVYPPVLHWTDRRPIGTVYLASSPSGNVNQPGGYQNNPRRYFNDSNASDFDVTTAAGLALFQARVLAQAQGNVANLILLHSAGSITWDIEGEQYPQNTSYICSPDQISTVAPEMESIIMDRNSKYVGMKLDDAYFKTMTDAGFRVGVCVRPQQFAINADGTAQQTYLPDGDVAQELIRKMQYAHSRWGATLFYIDSTVDRNGGVLPAAIFKQAAAALPDSLLIPEESTPLHFAYTAPFASFIDLGALGTPASTYYFYPNAFSATLVNDALATSLAAATLQLTTQVKQGDVLMAHVDYWQTNNPTIVDIYAAAGVSAAAPVPTPVVGVAPIITWAAPAAIFSGTALTSKQLNARASIPGTFTYKPTAGTVLPIGNSTISVTFTPQDLTHFKVTTESVTLTVYAPVTQPAPQPLAPVVPTVEPVLITSPATGASLSGQVTVQGSVNVNLDAAGSYLMVDGQKVGTAPTFAPFAYILNTSLYSSGTHSLQIWAHDTGNDTWVSPAVSIKIANSNASAPATLPVTAPVAPPVTSPMPSVNLGIVYPIAGATIAGVIQAEGQCSLNLDAAGSYLMVDGMEIGTHRLTSAPFLYTLDTTVLTNGKHTLQLWAHDVGNHTVVSSTVLINVIR